MNTSAIFFDIDGTIWDFRQQMPDSVPETMRRLKDNGHLTFLCSGRSRGNIINERLLSLPMTGIVAACGNHIEADGRILYERLLSWEELSHIMEVLRRARMPFIIEGPVDHWMNPSDFPGDWYVGNLWNALGDHAFPLDAVNENDRCSKVSASIPDDADYALAVDELSDTMDFLNHGNKVCEIIPKGSGKETGIRRVCELFDVAHENTYALGDGANDIGMLRYAAHGICMGNGTDGAKAAADHVTSDIHEDGLKRAMEHFHLI